MVKTNISNKTRLLFLLALATVLVFAGLSSIWGNKHAKAAFPGVNGKIVYVESPFSADPAGIYIMNSNGEERTFLTAVGGTTVASPKASPDGSQIAFFDSGNLKVMDIDGSNVETIADDAEGNDYGSVAWSPDGNKLAYSSASGGSPEIYTIDVDGSNKFQVTNSGHNYTPSWSPDGSQIAFHGDIDGGAKHIFVINADGENEAQLTDSGSPNYSPDWSPDGNQIAYIQGDSGTAQVMIMNADGSNKTVVRSGSNDFDVSWSPDGEKLVVVSAGMGAPALFTMDIDGQNVSGALTSNSVSFEPHWSTVSDAPFPFDEDGTEEDPYQIASCEELNGINWALDAYFLLTEDIECHDIMPIGGPNAFTGSLNGDEFKITFSIDSDAAYDYGYGLFSEGDGAEVTSLNLTGTIDVDIDFRQNPTGALFGEASGVTINNVDSTVDISVISNNSTGPIGGLIGYLENSNVTNSHTGDIFISVTDSGYGAQAIGGLIGQIDSSDVSSSSASGLIEINSSVSFSIGGFVGSADGTELTNNSSDFSIVTNSFMTNRVGGFAGELCGSGARVCIVENSSSAGDISGELNDASLIGGFVGSVYNEDGEVALSHVEAHVDIGFTGRAGGLDTADRFGGLIGESIGDIDYQWVYSTGDILMPDIYYAPGGTSAGGLFGEFYNGSLQNAFTTSNIYLLSEDNQNENDVSVGGLIGASFDGLIKNSYSAGSVTVDYSDLSPETVAGHVGGLIGYADDNVAIEDSFTVSKVETHEAIAQVGGLFGFYGSDTHSNIYWDQSRTQQTNCIGNVGSLEGCTAVNTNNNQVGYFINNSTNPPLSSWDFGDDEWQVNEDFYPTFEGHSFSYTPIDIPEEPEEPVTSVSFTNPVTNNQTRLEINGGGCVIDEVGIVAESDDNKDVAFDYPFGLMQFVVNCDTDGATTTINEYYFEDANPSDFNVRKYHSVDKIYFGVSGAIATKVTVDGQTAIKITYEITDGGILDIDGSVNGVIVDPVGLARSVVGVPNTGIGRINQ